MKLSFWAFAACCRYQVHPVCLGAPAVLTLRPRQMLPRSTLTFRQRLPEPSLQTHLVPLTLQLTLIPHVEYP
jgi:hypothetical protein